MALYLGHQQMCCQLSLQKAATASSGCIGTCLLPDPEYPVLDVVVPGMVLRGLLRHVL
jgi:hypothetical protein